MERFVDSQSSYISCLSFMLTDRRQSTTTLLKKSPSDSESRSRLPSSRTTANRPPVSIQYRSSRLKIPSPPRPEKSESSFSMVSTRLRFRLSSLDLVYRELSCNSLVAERDPLS